MKDINSCFNCPYYYGCDTSLYSDNCPFYKPTSKSLINHIKDFLCKIFKR